MNEERRTLYSIRSASAALAISPKTIQRALRAGRLRRHGSALKGHLAAFLDLAEVRNVCVKEKCRHGTLRRTKMRPLHCTIERQLEDAGLSARKVLLQYWKAAMYHEADIDFMMYCLSHLVCGNHTFIKLALGMVPEGPARSAGQPDTSLADPIVEYAARRLCRFAAGSSLDNDGISFKALWANIFSHCAKLPASIEPAIVYDHSESQGDLLLTPCWTKEAPAGLLPIVCGKVSCIRPHRIEFRIEVNEIASDLARRLEDERTRTGEDRRELIIRTIADSSIIYLPDDEEEIRQLCAELGFSSVDVKAAPFRLKIFIKAWTVLRGDVVDIGVRPGSSVIFNDDVDDDDDVDGKRRINIDPMSLGDQRPPARPSQTLLAELFGVSRQTVSRWLSGVVQADRRG